MAAKLTKGLADLSAALDQADARIDEDVTRFRTRIAELEAKVANETVTPEELAQLDTLKLRVDAIDPDNTTTRGDVENPPPTVEASTGTEPGPVGGGAEEV